MTTYAGFTADDHGLSYGSLWRLPWQGRARLSSKGVAFTQHNQVVEDFDWDCFLGVQPPNERTWWVHPRLLGRGSRPTAIEVGVVAAQGPTTPVFGQRSRKLADPFLNRMFPDLRQGGAVLQALCEYVAATSAARSGLDDPSRCNQLVAHLRASKISGPPRHEVRVYAGLKGEARDFVDQVADRNMRVFRGRPVAGEETPTPDQLAQLAAERLPHWADSRFTTPEGLRDLAAERLAVTPWPFGVLR